MVKEEILEFCRNAILKKFGRLDDLPYELANTVANIYYRFFLFGINLPKDAEDSSGWISQQMKDGDDFMGGMESFISEYAQVRSDFESINEPILALRDINKDTQPRLYAYSVELLLDIYKYNIPNAHKKIPIRRSIERIFKKKGVNEIPDLVDRCEVFKKIW